MPPGNPLATVPAEMICTRCHLPRHTAETLQKGTITLENGEKKKFCAKLPWQNARGHDIYGNPFPNPTVAGGKKGKKAQAEPETASNADSPTEDTPAITGKVAKNSGIVYFKCTNCGSEKVASLRYAAHLEKCLGLSGRKCSRAAMAKMNNSGSGSNGGSPMLQPTDTAKGASRKPSPEKLAIGNAATPALEDPSEMTIDVASQPPPLAMAKTNLPAPTAPVGIAATTTPKKKKKAAGAAVVKEETPAPSLSPQAVAPLPTPAKDPAQKKRKRKDDVGEPGPTPLKPKKHKTLLTGAGVAGLPLPPSAPATNITGTPKPKHNRLPKPTINPDIPLNTNSSITPQPLAALMSPQKAPAGLPKKTKSKAQRPPKLGGAAGNAGVPKKSVPAGAGDNDDSPKKGGRKKMLKPGAVGAGNVADKTVPGMSRIGVAGKSVPGVARKGLPGGGGGIGGGGNV